MPRYTLWQQVVYPGENYFRVNQDTITQVIYFVNPYLVASRKGVYV
jgi:predicted transcriptional regulator